MVEAKVFYRCLVNNFGYCRGEPDFSYRSRVTQAEKGEMNIITGGQCKARPETCGKYQTIMQQVQAERKAREKHARQIRANGKKGKGTKRDAAPRSS